MNAPAANLGSARIAEQEVRWMGVSMRLPRDWHIRRHSVSPETGRLVFVDRRVQRLDLIWSRPAKEPDTRRMVDHAVESFRDSHPGTHVSPRLPSRIRGWEGFVYGDSPRIYRAVHYHAEYNVLLQATLSMDGDREETHQQVRELLSDISVAEHPDTASHWRAFGMEFHVPESFSLQSTKVQPMNVAFTFMHFLKRPWRRTRKGLCTVRRMGMAGDWFDGNLESFARKRAAGRRCEIAPDRARGALHAEFIPRGLHAPGKTPGQGRERVWYRHDPETNSLFEVSLINIPESEKVVAELDLRGCPEWLALAEENRQAAAAAPHDVEGARDALAEGIPVHNDSVSLEKSVKGAVLRVPMRERWWTRGVVRWMFPVRENRAFGMDAFGAEVWSECDGSRTVEMICEGFARRHAVSYEEAKAAVYQFLQTLTRRDLIVIQMPTASLENSLENSWENS